MKPKNLGFSQINSLAHLKSEQKSNKKMAQQSAQATTQNKLNRNSLFSVKDEKKEAKETVVSNSLYHVERRKLTILY